MSETRTRNVSFNLDAEVVEFEANINHPPREATLCEVINAVNQLGAMLDTRLCDSEVALSTLIARLRALETRAREAPAEHDAEARRHALTPKETDLFDSLAMPPLAYLGSPDLASLAAASWQHSWLAREADIARMAGAICSDNG